MPINVGHVRGAAPCSRACSLVLTNVGQASLMMNALDSLQPLTQWPGLGPPDLLRPEPEGQTDGEGSWRPGALGTEPACSIYLTHPVMVDSLVKTGNRGQIARPCSRALWEMGQDEPCRPQGHAARSPQQMSPFPPVLLSAGLSLLLLGVRCHEENAGRTQGIVGGYKTACRGVRCRAQLDKLEVGVGSGEGQGRRARAPVDQDQTRMPPLFQDIRFLSHLRFCADQDTATAPPVLIGRRWAVFLMGV